MSLYTNTLLSLFISPCVCSSQFGRNIAAVHSLKLSRTHVDWHSVDEVYLYSDATTSKIARSVTQKLGFSKGQNSAYAFPHLQGNFLGLKKLIVVAV